MNLTYTPEHEHFEATKHPIEEEHHLNQTSIFGFHVNFLRCKFGEHGFISELALLVKFDEPDFVHTTNGTPGNQCHWLKEGAFF